MEYQHNIEGCLKEAIGEYGVSSEDLLHLQPVLQKALLKFQKIYEEGSLPHLKLPFVRKDLTEIKDLALRFQDSFSDILILGTGGSSLGGQMVTALRDNTLPRLHFLDNIDPHTFEKTLKSIKPESTGVIAISKSGSTAETLLQFLSCVHHWQESLSTHSLEDHFIVITERKSSPLFRLAERFHMPILEHDANLGGRFSVLSTVGLLPALLADVDPVAFREGAASVITALSETTDVMTCAPALGAALSHIFFQQKQCAISVLMPYCDRLQYLSKWYAQLWAESLGKDGKGTTPVDALGAVDQHSQLQLYLDGPRDKIYTVITTDYENQGPTPLGNVDDVDLEYLYGKRVGDLIVAEQRATIETLIKNKRPTRVIHVPTIGERSLGALSMHFILETLFAAEIMNVNPFDQPAVEEGKILAKQYLMEK